MHGSFAHWMLDPYNFIRLLAGSDAQGCDKSAESLDGLIELVLRVEGLREEGGGE